MRTFFAIQTPQIAKRSALASRSLAGPALLRRAALTALLALATGGAHAATGWTEGTHYSLITPAQPKTVPADKVEVTEVFSYACPACRGFYPAIDKLKASLPKNAQLVYLPASFIPSEDWPMFQRAFYTAQALGLVDKTHDAMFKAIWDTNELAIADQTTNLLKKPAPSIEDAAKFYNRLTGVKVATFLDTAKSMGVDVNMHRADMLIKAYQVDSTPTIVINGKYRLSPRSAGGYEQLIELVKWLVAKESVG